MNRWTPTLTFITVAAASLPALAQDAAAGKARAEAVCSACHGLNGVSVSDTIPNLAGQKAAYLQAQLRALKDGTRKNAIMNAIATQLAPEDIANVAAYFSSLPGASVASAKSELLPNLVKTSAVLPEGYPAGFTMYTTVNRPDINQVRYLYANDVARRPQAGGRQRRLLREGPLPRLRDHGPRPGLGQGHPRDPAQRGLELLGLHAREEAARGRQPGRVPGLPQAAGQGELHLLAGRTDRQGEGELSGRR